MFGFIAKWTSSGLRYLTSNDARFSTSWPILVVAEMKGQEVAPSNAPMTSDKAVGGTCATIGVSTNINAPHNKPASPPTTDSIARSKKQPKQKPVNPRTIWPAIVNEIKPISPLPPCNAKQPPRRIPRPAQAKVILRIRTNNLLRNDAPRRSVSRSGQSI